MKDGSLHIAWGALAGIDGMDGIDGIDGRA
jgi:hypothetical protein